MILSMRHRQPCDRDIRSYCLQESNREIGVIELRALAFPRDMHLMIHEITRLLIIEIAKIHLFNYARKNFFDPSEERLI